MQEVTWQLHKEPVLLLLPLRPLWSILNPAAVHSNQHESSDHHARVLAVYGGRPMLQMLHVKHEICNHMSHFRQLPKP